MADRQGGREQRSGGKGRQGNRDMGEKRAPAGRQSNGAGSRRRVANVGQASRWVGEGQMKAGATRGSGDPSASVSGRLEEWAALRLGRLVLLLVCISGAMSGPDASWLGRKHEALGTLTPQVSSNGNLWPML